MFVKQAETCFRKGMQLLARGHAKEALPFISAALQIQREVDDAGYSQATYLSYHGLCMCLTRSGMREGLRDCRQACAMDACNPDIWWNLGRVTLMIGRRAEAQRACHEGLRIQPGHAGILRLLREMGLRREPVLSFLSRENPINVMLGRLQHRTPRPAKLQREPHEIGADRQATRDRAGTSRQPSARAS